MAVSPFIIETAAKALFSCSFLDDVVTWDQIDSVTQDDYRRDAAAVLEAVGYEGLISSIRMIGLRAFETITESHAAEHLGQQAEVPTLQGPDDGDVLPVSSG